MHVNSLNPVSAYTPFDFSILTLIGITTTAAVLIGLFSAEPGLVAHGVLSPYCFAMLATIYVWKYSILRCPRSRFTKRKYFGLLLLSLLPFVYWRCFPIPTVRPWSVGFWIGNPVWMFVIPSASFFLFDLQRKFVSGNDCFVRSLIEMFVVFPIWSCAWALLMIGFGWGSNWYWLGC